MSTIGRIQMVMVDVFEEDNPIHEMTVASDFQSWDSLGNIRLFIALENEFDIRFSTAEISGLKNVGELVRVIDAKREGRL